MPREMRRKKQSLPSEESIKILIESTSGVLSVTDVDAYPYTVPMSYVYENEKIYMHSSMKGHKIDALKENNKVCFCIIDSDHVVPQEFTTHYKSVVVFGKGVIVSLEEEKRKALTLLANKYSPAYMQKANEEIKKALRATAIIRIDIEEITGKQAIKLI